MNNENEHGDGLNPGLKRQSLLAKYEIPIDHLSYEHIRGCTSIRELERIVKILRSGEEGHFPDLQKQAEDRLGHLSPNNRLLRVETPALNRNCLSRKEWETIMNDIGNWKKDVALRDARLCDSDDCDVREITQPPVRQSLSEKVSEKSEIKSKAKNKVSDYAFWDKYDVDTELLKLDLEDERGKRGEEKTATMKTEEDRPRFIAEEIRKCSEQEKEVLAEQEKVRGNEFYQAKDYKEAVKYYTASLAILPTAKAYNNRASCYLKENKYPLAVRDADSTLKLEPKNIKALFRKGIALKNMNIFQDALESINEILTQDPNHLQAQNIAKQLKEIISENMKMSDCQLKEFKPTENKNLLDNHNHFSSESKQCFEVNEFGLPKSLCRCIGSLKGKNKTENKIKHLTSSFPFQIPVNEPKPVHAEKKSGNVQIIELTDEYELPKKGNSTKLEILEVETSPREPTESTIAPRKRNVVDKRTQITGSDNGGGLTILPGIASRVPTTS